MIYRINGSVAVVICLCSCMVSCGCSFVTGLRDYLQSLSAVSAAASNESEMTHVHYRPHNYIVEYTPLMLAYIVLCLYLYFSVREFTHSLIAVVLQSTRHTEVSCEIFPHNYIFDWCCTALWLVELSCWMCSGNVSVCLGKIEMVKSKWGLALSAMITVFASLLMSVSLCVFFGLTPSLNGR